MFDVGGLDSLLKRLDDGVERLKLNDKFLSERFSRNITVLEEFFPDIYAVIKDYEPVNKNIFVESDGALNLFFPELGCCIYPENAFFNIDKRFKEFSKNPDKTHLDITGNEGHSLHENYLHKVNYLRKTLQKKHPKHEGLPKVIGGLVMFGFELGYQLVRILDDCYAKHIYIYEKNLDLFYYSLYAIDWNWLAEKIVKENMTLHFFLGKNEKEFVNEYISFIRFNGMYMCSQTYVYMSYESDELKNVFSEFSNQYSRQIMGWGFFDDGVIGIGQYLARKNDTHLLLELEDSKKVFKNKKIDLPVLILGNGPSLDDNIEFVKNNIDNFLVVSCGTTLNTLYKYGIKPDFHVDLERLKHTSEKIEYIEKDFLRGIAALTVNVMHPDFYDHFDKAIIGLRPGEPLSSMMMEGKFVSDEAKNRLGYLDFCAPVVANLAMSYVRSFGFSSVYMVGVDCGFLDPEQHHSKKSGYYHDDGRNTGLAEFKYNLKQREANFGGKAYTTEIMDTSRIYLELCIESMKKKNPLFSCYNLSNGVKISGALPIESDDIILPNFSFSSKNEIKEYIFNNFVLDEFDENCSRDIGDVSEEFKKFTEQIKLILNRDFATVIELMETLSECNSLIMKQNYLSRRYNYELFSGSFIYFANEIVNFALSTPESTVLDSRKMLDILIDFINEMPGMLDDPVIYVDKGRGLLDGKYNG